MSGACVRVPSTHSTRLRAGYAQDKFRSPAGEHGGILTDFQTKVNKKMTQRIILLWLPPGANARTAGEWLICEW
jgi:hypothetical protein